MFIAYGVSSIDYERMRDRTQSTAATYIMLYNVNFFHVHVMLTTGLGRDEVDAGASAVNGRHYVPNASDVRTLDNFLRTDIHMDTPEGKYHKLV